VADKRVDAMVDKRIGQFSGADLAMIMPSSKLSEVAESGC
jgi:hypothetical protein